MAQDTRLNLQRALDARFSDAPSLNDKYETCDLLLSILSRGSCRRFTANPVSTEILDILCAAALASPTKSDLQQRDIIVLQSPDVRQCLSDLLSGQAWVANAPIIAVFCGNNRRQRLLHEWQGVPFKNDHLDAFFNSATDAAIALGAFVIAAESLGLGCCPISAVRNEADAVSELLGLPGYVFPFAGLAIGYPRQQATISKRLPLRVSCHVDQYRENNLQEVVQSYDTDRADTQPYPTQRFPDTFGKKGSYGWSDDKVRQYSKAERASFGKFVRAQGFCLD